MALLGNMSQLRTTATPAALRFRPCELWIYIAFQGCFCVFQIGELLVSLESLFSFVSLIGSSFPICLLGLSGLSLFIPSCQVW